MFKKGDKLLCVDIADSRFLEKGKIYTYEKRGKNNCVRIKEALEKFPMYRYSESNFQLAIPYLNEQKLKKALGLEEK